MMKDKKEFGEYLRSLRDNRGLTIHQVEAFCGVSNSYLSLIENGKRGIPKPTILKKLAPVYKVPYEELMVKAGHLPDYYENNPENNIAANEDTLPYLIPDNAIIHPSSGDIFEGLPADDKKSLLEVINVYREKNGLKPYGKE